MQDQCNTNLNSVKLLNNNNSKVTFKKWILFNNNNHCTRVTSALINNKLSTITLEHIILKSQPLHSVATFCFQKYCDVGQI